ncbi:N-acetylmuramoyl-L-alanine amidase [Streptomyces sp. NPDC059718]
MATPLSPDKFIEILRAEGVKVAEYPGWRTRSRDAATNKAFGPVHLLLNHHTGGSNSLRLVAETGRPDLPAPLAHTHLAKSGLATMCSARRANHAGTMALNAYNSFADEKTSHPTPAKSSGTVDGNDLSYGIEVENLGNGADTYTRTQYDALVRWNAALCRHFGWSAESVAGHRETSVEGKVDPLGPVEGYGSRGRFNLTMSQLRGDVAERLTQPASWSPEEDDMPLTADEISRVAQATAQAVWAKKLTNPHRPVDGKPGQTTASALQTSEDGHYTSLTAQIKALGTQVTGLSAAVTSLAGQLGDDVDTAQVVAAVEAAIARAVVKVDVSVGDATA